MSQHLFQRAESVDQFGRDFGTDAGNPGHVVGAVARQRLHVNHFVGINAEFFPDVFGGKKLVFHRIVKLNPGTDQLHQVFVRRHDHRFHALFERQPRVGGNQVVGFIAFHLQIIEL